MKKIIHLDGEKRDASEKPKGDIWERLSAIVLFATMIFETVFRKQDYDTVFDSGGKAVIIVLMILFLVIYYIQIKKNDKVQK